MTDRERRLAANETVFREVNEQIERVAERHGEGDGEHPYEFLCECSNADCDLQLTLTLREYEAVRAHPDRFAVAPGHDLPDIERVVEERPGYLVIEKQGEAGRLVVERDPRRSD